MRFSPLILICLLAACASPYDRCVRSATDDANTLSELIAETEANIARGFAIDEQVSPRINYQYCFNARGVWTLCRKRDLQTKEVPVAIDLAAEERKLAGMRTKLEQLKTQAGRDIRACRAQFPES
ncbi:MAG: hypothetical protein AAFQ47_05305 [Pseudomonadota bacterium]